MPPLIHIALCHYQFEAIHPFLDGNGRVGRLLITLLLLKHDLLPTPLLYLSAFFESTRDEYYRQLYNVSSKGNWNEWFLYFLHGVATQSADVLLRAEHINKCIADWTEIVNEKPHSITHAIIQGLAANPYCSTAKISEQHGIAFTTAQRAIKKLESLNILEKVTEKKRSVLYYAKAILDILEEPTKIDFQWLQE